MAFPGGSVSLPQQNQTISDFEQSQSQTEQQHQQQHSRQTFGSNDLKSTFASPRVPAANPPLEVDRQSSASTQGQGPHSWQDSPASNQAEGLASPISSVISPHNYTNSPKLPPIDPLIFHSASETKPSLPIEAIESPKRRRGRPRISEDDGPDVVAPKTGTEARQKGSTRRASNTSTSGAIDTGDKRSGAEAKKNKIRARNREAAYKCRKKKQKGVEELQTQEAMAENINKNLNDEAALLRGEILMLKTMVLQHGSCGCSFIEEYISGAAQNLVSSSMAGGTSASASGGGGIQMDTQPCPDGANEGESYIDWKMFDADTEQGIPSMGTEHSLELRS